MQPLVSLDFHNVPFLYRSSFDFLHLFHLLFGCIVATITGSKSPETTVVNIGSKHA